MPEKHDGPGLLSESDMAIFQYLDEMLVDPCEGSGTSAPAAKSAADAEEPPPARSNNMPRAQLQEHSNSLAIHRAQSLMQSQPRTQPQPTTNCEPLPARPLLLEEPPKAKIIASPETLLRLQQPAVVQQPAVSEKPVVVQPKTEVDAFIDLKAEEKPAGREHQEVIAVPSSVSEPAEAKDTSLPEVVEPEQVPVVEQNEEDLSEVALATLEEPGDDRLPPMQPWCDNGRPDWGQSRFECLLFEVAGLKLAVPLVTLGAVHQIDRKFTSLPGQYDWFIGIMQTHLGNIKVIDTALCVMPERYDRNNRETLEFVITLHGFAWGISCHKLLRSITLDPDDVKWRTQRGKRPWMAGTVVEQMCALIDPAGFHYVIREAERRAD